MAIRQTEGQAMASREFAPGDLVYYKIDMCWEESDLGVNVMVTREVPATVVRQTDKRVVIRLGWREHIGGHRSVYPYRLRGM